MKNSSHLPAYEDGTQCSETSAYKIQTPGNYPEESIQQVHRSLQNCESSVGNLLHVILLVPGILRWLLHFSKVCGPLFTAVSYVILTLG